MTAIRRYRVLHNDQIIDILCRGVNIIFCRLLSCVAIRKPRERNRPDRYDPAQKDLPSIPLEVDQANTSLNSFDFSSRFGTFFPQIGANKEHFENMRLLRDQRVNIFGRALVA